MCVHLSFYCDWVQVCVLEKRLCRSVVDCQSGVARVHVCDRARMSALVQICVFAYEEFKQCDTSRAPLVHLSPNLCRLPSEITELTHIWIFRLLTLNVNYRAEAAFPLLSRCASVTPVAWLFCGGGKRTRFMWTKRWMFEFVPADL